MDASMSKLSVTDEDWCVVPEFTYSIPMEQEEDYISPSGAIKHLKFGKKEQIIETQFETQLINEWILFFDKTHFPTFWKTNIISLDTKFGRQIFKIRSGEIKISANGRKRLEENGFQF